MRNTRQRRQQILQLLVEHGNVQGLVERAADRIVGVPTDVRGQQLDAGNSDAHWQILADIRKPGNPEALWREVIEPHHAPGASALTDFAQQRKQRAVPPLTRWLTPVIGKNAGQG